MDLETQIEFIRSIEDEDVRADLMLASTWHSLIHRLNDNIALLRIAAGPDALRIPYHERRPMLEEYRKERVR